MFTVLGATGFVGGHLVGVLRRQGHEVHTPPRAMGQVFDRPLGHVIYCIGLTADFRSRPFDTARAHVGVLTDVLERAAFDSLLYLSSTRIYSHASEACEHTPVPVIPTDPTDIFNATKLAGEALCFASGRTKVRVARLSNVLGRDFASENFVFALIREALAGQIELRANAASAKDYILIDDVATLLPRIAMGGREAIYNVASGVNTTHGEIVARLVELTGCDVRYLDKEPALRFPPIDVTRIRSEFDFTPTSAVAALPGLVAEAYKSRIGP
jgi:nucleoside-diphosphate-sugar epimerase